MAWSSSLLDRRDKLLNKQNKTIIKNVQQPKVEVHEMGKPMWEIEVVKALWPKLATSQSVLTPRNMQHLSQVIKAISTREVTRGSNSITQLGKEPVLPLPQPETKPLHRQQHQEPFSINEIEICQHAAIRMQVFKVKHLIGIWKLVIVYLQTPGTMLKSWIKAQ